MNERYNQILREKQELVPKMKDASEKGNNGLFMELFREYKNLESEAKKIHSKYFGG